MELKDFIHRTLAKTANQWSSGIWHGTCIYAVSKRVTREDFKAVRAKIEVECGSKRFVQAIESSVRFKEHVTQHLKSSLAEELGKNTVIVYGVTGESVNCAVRDILRNSSTETRKYVVGNIVDASFEFVCTDDVVSLPGHLTYMFDVVGTDSTKFGDDNVLADVLSDTIIVVGGGAQTLEQMDIALTEEKSLRIVVSRQENVQMDDAVSAGDAVALIMKKWTCTRWDRVGERASLEREALEQLKGLYTNWESNARLRKLPTYLAKWKMSGHLKRIHIETAE